MNSFTENSAVECDEMHQSEFFCLNSLEMKEQGHSPAFFISSAVAFALLKMSTHSCKTLVLAVDFICNPYLGRVCAQVMSHPACA